MTEPFPEKRTRNAEKKCYDKEFNIQAVYPKSRLQRCIVHQIRSSTRFVSWKDIKQVTADLKKIYTSVTLDEAEETLLQFSEKWRKQYPSCVKCWEENWEVLRLFVRMFGWHSPQKSSNISGLLHFKEAKKEGRK